MNFLKKKELNEKHIGVLTKFAALRGEILSGRIPIKGKDSKGCKPDQFVNNYYRMHDLIRGIYAYKDAKFALSIMIKDTGMYGNEITYFSPENWRINYKPPTDARGKHDIKTLQNCFSKNIPIGVLRNLKHATNEVLGLGKIIDEKNGIFSIVPLILSLEDENNVEHYTDAYYDKKIQTGDYSAPDVRTTATARVGQAKFKKLLLPIYGSQCAFCGFNLIDFLIASHIVPHSKDKKNRLNPRNGFLLCRMCDNAFERGYLKTFPSLRISKTKKLTANSNKAVEAWLANINNKVTIKDEKFIPLPKFINKRNRLLKE